MTTFLLEEETLFEPSLLLQIPSRTQPAKDTFSILLRMIRILDNRRLFGSADVVIHCVTVNGFPDMKSGKPFWNQQISFYKVKDGYIHRFDDAGTTGYLLFRGRPHDFLNLYILVFRDMQSTREFAQLLNENFISEGIGYVTGGAISIYANLPPTITLPMIRDMTTNVVKATTNFFSRRKNVVIGVYYGSLLRGEDYGMGIHPPDYNPSQQMPKLLNCGDALQIAYEVRRE
jgi:hypothetical protein